MSAYNAAMNDRVYVAAARLSDGERRRDRGAFWHSIHGTLNHLLWADRMWMARFAGWECPVQPLSDSDRLFEDFAAMRAARAQTDADLSSWAADLQIDWLAQDQTWFSGAVRREVRASRAMLLVHLFNHQTHHRGQVHAMLTAVGEQTGDTDLWLLMPTER
jgi:uncharacterized damage-inducible protein DinB